MNILQKKINQNDFFGIIIISIFSLAVNQYYGNLGIFPHDSFSHFGTGHMIINGSHPFTDFWIVSGPFIDYFQAFLFKIFGSSWKIYVFHASIINLLVTTFTFILLRNLNLDFKRSVFFSLCFSILAYPTSGTPFVDHHSTFFSLIGIYLILNCIVKESKHICFFIPLFFILGFLSKQVPASYLAVSIIPIFFLYLFFNKKFFLINYFFFGSLFFIFLITLFSLINGISLINFFEQYILYPQSIAKNRFENLNISIISILGNFKFIFISLVILILIKAIKIKKINLFLKTKENYILLIILITSFALMFHQILTRNQIFIFFLIPLVLGIASIDINDKFLKYAVIIICLFSTIKYHERFNEGRKFHELQNVNLNLAVDAKLIDEKLAGLKWITPQFKNNPLSEIKVINEIKLILKNDKRNKMVFGNYQFLSVILNQNLFYTTRWHVFDGSDYPLPKSSYFESYKKLNNQVAKKNDVKAVYSILPVTTENIYDLFGKDCLVMNSLNEFITRYEFKKC